MSVYKLQIHTTADSDTITRADFAKLLNMVALQVESYPHISSGTMQDLHDTDEVRIGGYLLVARFEEPTG